MATKAELEQQIADLQKQTSEPSLAPTTKVVGLLKMQKQEERTEKVTYGTLGSVIEELAGIGAQYKPWSKRNVNSEMALQLRIFHPNDLDTFERIGCSATVSKGLRSQEIKFTDLLNFPVNEHTSDRGASKGQTFAQVQMPEYNDDTYNDEKSFGIDATPANSFEQNHPDFATVLAYN